MDSGSLQDAMLPAVFMATKQGCLHAAATSDSYLGPQYVLHVRGQCVYRAPSISGRVGQQKTTIIIASLGRLMEGLPP